MTSISVIIPAYNRADLIGTTLESLMNQTLSADEIIVVDDGSTDTTASVAESFGSPVTVIHQENSGPAAARNAGLKASTGEFVHFFDSDDIASSNKHEVQVKALLDSNADIAYSPWEKGSIKDEIFTSSGVVLQHLGLPKDNLVTALLTHWSIVPIACLFRRELVVRVGGFPTSLFGTEDQLMFLRCLLAGAKVVHTPESLVLYRNDNTGKITDPKSGKNRHIIEWAKFLITARAECTTSGIDPAEWFGYRRRVWQTLQDFKTFEIDNEELAGLLRQALGTRNATLTYSLGTAAERKWQGAKQRLLGYREHAHFMAKKVDKRTRQL